jgi:hypothetical protein
MGLAKSSKLLGACKTNEQERITYDAQRRLLREDEYPMLEGRNLAALVLADTDTSLQR